MNEKDNNTQKAVNPIPEGFHSVTPIIIATHAALLIEFIKEAFDAKVNYVMSDNDGKVAHAEVKIGNSMIMVSDASERFPAMTTMLHLYVEDVDAVYQKAIKAKGTSIRPPGNEFYGDRSGGVKDTWGNQWWLATHIEDVNDEEMKKREEEFRKKG